MKHLRHAITAATLIAAMFLGAATMTAPQTASAALAPQTAQDGAVAQFWQFMYGLQTTQAQCIALTESTHSVTLYEGNCLQAFVIALETPGVAWEYVN